MRELRSLDFVHAAKGSPSRCVERLLANADSREWLVPLRIWFRLAGVGYNRYGIYKGPGGIPAIWEAEQSIRITRYRRTRSCGRGVGLRGQTRLRVATERAPVNTLEKPIVYFPLILDPYFDTGSVAFAQKCSPVGTMASSAHTRKISKLS